MQPWWIDFLRFIPQLIDSALEIARLIFFLLGIRLILAALPLVEAQRRKLSETSDSSRR